MARNGSGVYSLPVGYEATAGATATATQHNSPLEDLETDMNTARPIVAGGTGATNATDARSNLGVTTIISNISNGTTEINPNLGTTTEYDGTALVGRPLTNGEAATLGKGFTNTTHDDGTKTTGTFTIDEADNNIQRIVNGGAFTLAPPSLASTDSCSVVVKITNNASAGAITTSGFTRTIGDAFTTTDGDKFMCFVAVDGSDSVLNVVALQ